MQKRTIVFCVLLALATGLSSIGLLYYSYALEGCSTMQIVHTPFFCFSLCRFDSFLDTAIKILGWGATATGTIIAAYNLRENSLDRKRHASFEMIGKWNDLDGTQSRKDVVAFLSSLKGLPPERLRKIADNSRYRHRISSLLGVLEDFALAYRLNFIDRRIAILSLEPAILNHYTDLKPYIDAKRLGYTDPSIYCEFEELAMTLQARKSLKDTMEDKEANPIRRFRAFLVFRWRYPA